MTEMWPLVQMRADVHCLCDGHAVLEDKVSAAKRLFNALDALGEREQNAGELVATTGCPSSHGVTFSQYDWRRLGKLPAGTRLYTHPAQAVSVPDEKEDLDPVRLHKIGRFATDYEWGYNGGWNDCREAMLASTPTEPTDDGGSHE